MHDTYRPMALTPHVLNIPVIPPYPSCSAITFGYSHNPRTSTVSLATQLCEQQGQTVQLCRLHCCRKQCGGPGTCTSWFECLLSGSVGLDGVGKESIKKEIGPRSHRVPAALIGRRSSVGHKVTGRRLTKRNIAEATRVWYAKFSAKPGHVLTVVPHRLAAERAFM